MAIAENSYPHKMGSSCPQILDPEIWLSDPFQTQKYGMHTPVDKHGKYSPGRLALVHSLDQSTIWVIQDPIDGFVNRDPQKDGKNFQNDTEPIIWAR